MLMKATVQRLDGLTMTGTAQSNHWITLDTSKELGGQAAATTPLEAILISTGSCLGMFIAGMFKKHKKDLSRLVIEVIGEKADERTPYLTKITLICNITSDADQAFIAPILEKAPDRCPVLVTLRQGLEIVVQGNYAG
jgi:uncharacterized OsmC-like protein